MQTEVNARREISSEETRKLESGINSVERKAWTNSTPKRLTRSKYVGRFAMPVMAILGDLAVPAIGQTADGPGQKLPAARAFASALLGFAGDADGGEFVPVAVEPAGEAQAQGAGIKLVGLALAVERDGRDEKTLRARRQQFTMEHKAEAATFLHTEDLKTFGDPLFDLGEELFAGKLARGMWIAMIFLRDGHDEFEVDVQAELEHGLGGVNDGGGQRLARRKVPRHCGLVRARGRGYGGACRDGFEDVIFH